MIKKQAPAGVCRVRFLLPALLALAFLTGCSPSLAPLYVDFDAGKAVRNASNADDTSGVLGADAMPQPTRASLDIDARIRRAVQNAGWEVTNSVAENVVATEPRLVNRWGLYYTEVSIEVSRVNDTFVRVLVHPYRVYFTGHRSKMPFLKRSIRRAVFTDLEESFDAEGIVAIGNAVERDKKTGR